MSTSDETVNGARPAVLSWLPGTIVLDVAMVLFVAVGVSDGPSVPRLICQLSALLFLCGAGLLAAHFIAAARHRGPFERRALGAGTRGSSTLGKLRAVGGGFWTRLANIDWRGDWFAVVAAGLPSLLALYAVFRAWTIAGPTPSAVFNQWAAACLVIAAFPVLVFERYLAELQEDAVPEAASLARLFRVPIFVLLALGISAGLRWLDLPGWMLIEHFADLVIALVAAEIALRCVAFLFIPLPPIALRRSPADSFIAGLIRLQWPDPNAVNTVVAERFGIDLARSWALAFIRRATFPMLIGMAFACWLLTGVTALGINERAVYEAFGKPQAVFEPGLHVHLPWPFGVLRPVEFGVIREIPIVFAANGNITAEQAEHGAAMAQSIEGAPPASADRLWDADHPSEASYLVASVSNGQQNFEVVDIDLRIVYRIGLSDAAALDSVYNIASPETMVRAASGRMLARYFARYTIADVLGQNREAFIRGFEKELQTRLSALNTGVEVMAVVVEAIHPPPGAAASYQGVQASAMRAQVQVENARADAIAKVKDAEKTAIKTRDDATAAAAERIDEATAATALFAGDRQAYAEGGDAFLFERRLEHLLKGLADMPLIIFDHRITHDNALTLDLRPPTAAPTTIPEEP